MTGTDLTPQPLVWPVCPTCETPWALLREGTRWLFTRDCRHRVDPVLCNADGPLP